MLLFLFPVTCLAIPYEQCYLENSRGVTDPAIREDVKRICQEKHTPKKCRKYLPHMQSENISDMERDMIDTSLKGCLASCDKSGFFNKNFGGDCSVD
jgi:hypothetical protein